MVCIREDRSSGHEKGKVVAGRIDSVARRTGMLSAEGAQPRASWNRAEVERVTASWESSRSVLLRRCMCWTKGDALEAEDLLSDAYVRGLEAAGNARSCIHTPLKWWSTIIANLGRDRF